MNKMWPVPSHIRDCHRDTQTTAGCLATLMPYASAYFSFDCILSSIDTESSASQALKILSKKHAQGYGVMDTSDLRKEVGLPFTRNQQQDVEEFLTALISRNDFLNALTTNIMLVTKKCRNPSCGYSTANRDTKNFVRLYTGQESKPVHIKKLVDDSGRRFRGTSLRGRSVIRRSRRLEIQQMNRDMWVAVLIGRNILRGMRVNGSCSPEVRN